MLEARKSVWFEKIYALYNRNLFKRRFHSFRISGLNNLKEPHAQTPLVIYANHSSWWDGLTAFEISRAARLNSFVMMEEKQLRHLPLFRRLGAFSVVRENPREAVRSINYAADLLRQDSQKTIWIFPQGGILPNEIRPLKFFRGLARIVEKIRNCLVVPIAIQYEFFGNYKPEILIKVGSPKLFSISKDFGAKEETAEFECHLTETLDSLKMDVWTKNLQNYENIF